MENNNDRPSDSLYSYSFINRENKTSSDSNEVQNENQNITSQSVSENQNGGAYFTMNQGSSENQGSGEGSQSQSSNIYQNSEDQSSSGQGTRSQAAAGYPEGSAPQSHNFYSAGTSGAGNGGPGGFSPYEQPKKKKREKKPKVHRKQGFGMKAAKCAALALVFGLVGGTTFYGTGYVFDYASGSGKTQTESQKKVTTNSSDKITPTNTNTGEVVTDVSDVVNNAMPSIVAINNLSQVQYRDLFGQVYNQEVPSAGSGIIVAQTEDELFIVTNNHVVSGAETISVNFFDDQSVSAEVKGTDASTDLAVVSVKIKDIPAETLSNIKVATLGDSGALKVGEPAIAIGNALGYGQSVTTGVISALDREVTIEDANQQSVTNNLIQTDAAINPGNSGGALLNINGEVIGINSVKYSDTDVEGMGYAIPISSAEPIINDLITREAVDESKTAYLGITGVDVTSEVSETYNMPKGIYVTQVSSGSAAEAAGIKQGDIITSFDGREVESMESLADRMQYYEAGSKVEVKVMTAQRGEYEENTISVTLGKKN